MADDIYIDHSIIECGFFNAREITAGEYDRTYFADDFCKPYHRIVSDSIVVPSIRISSQLHERLRLKL